MEVSSHALDQARVGAVRFRTAVFTNLTRDHLDYHGTMDSYGATKARLFAREDLVSRVINVDDAFGRQLAARSARPRPRSSSPAAATSRARAAPPASCAPCTSSCRRAASSSSSIRAGAPGALVCPLVGDFNVDNLLTVIAVLLDWDTAARAGRRQRWRACTPRPAAWKPSAADARRSRSSTTRTRPTRCARRWPRRARIASAGSRWCSAAAAIAIPASARSWARSRPSSPTTSSSPTTTRAASRRRRSPRTSPRAFRPASRFASSTIARAPSATRWSTPTPRDVVLIAGKGHEDYQIYGDERRAFSDQKVVAAALAARCGRCGMNRTLAEFARCLRRHAARRRSRLHRRVHRHAHAQGRRAVRRAARPALQRQRFRRGRGDRGRGRRRGRLAASSGRWRRWSCATPRRL